MQENPKKKIFIDSKNQKLLDALITQVTSEEVLLYFDVEISCSDFLIQEGRTAKQIQRANYDFYLSKVSSEYDIFIYDLNSDNLNRLQTHLKIIKNFFTGPSPKKFVLISNVFCWETAEKIFEQENEELSKTIIDEFKEDEPGKENEAESSEGKQAEAEQEEQLELELELSEQEDEDKESDLAQKEGAANNEEKPLSRPCKFFGEGDHLRRMGKGKYLRMIGVENLALNLMKSCDFLTVNILCPGVIYGEEEEMLGELFKMAWLQNPDSLPVLGKGTNEFPMVHLRDLVVFVKFAALEFMPRTPYIFVSDRSKKRLQRHLIKALASALGKGKVTKSEPALGFYPSDLVRVLSLDVKWRASSLLKKHEERLLQTKERLAEIAELEQRISEQAEEGPGEDDLRRLAELKSQLRPVIEYKLEFEDGFAKNIAKLKEEYIQSKSLSRIKVLVLGGPFSGKSTLALKIAKRYNLPYLSPESVLEHFLGLKDSFAEELIAMLEQKRQEVFDKGQEEFELLKKKGKNLPRQILSKEQIKASVPDKTLIKMLKTRLAMNDCVNRGYVLDGFPSSFNTAARLFTREIKRPPRRAKRLRAGSPARRQRGR